MDILINNASGWVADTFSAVPAGRFGHQQVRVSAQTINRQFAVDARGSALLISEFARRHAARGCRPQIIRTAPGNCSSRQQLEAIFVMQTAENRLCSHTMAVANPMATGERREVIAPQIRNARSQAHMWPSSVVVHHPLPQDASHVPLVQRDHPVQTLAPDCTDHLFAERTPAATAPVFADRQTHRLIGRHAIRVDATRPRMTNRWGPSPGTQPELLPVHQPFDGPSHQWIRRVPTSNTTNIEHANVAATATKKSQGDEMPAHARSASLRRRASRRNTGGRPPDRWGT